MAFYIVHSQDTVPNENRSKTNQFSPVGKVLDDPQSETKEQEYVTIERAGQIIERFKAQPFDLAKYGQEEFYQIFMAHLAGNEEPISTGEYTAFSTKEEADAMGSGSVRWSGVAACLLHRGSLFYWLEDRHGLTAEQTERLALGYHQAVLLPETLRDGQGYDVTEEVQGKAVVDFFMRKRLPYPTKAGKPDYEKILSFCRANAKELANQHYPMFFLRERKEKGESDHDCLLRLLLEEMHMRPRTKADVRE